MAYSNGYTYRKKITIDYTKVIGGANLSSFPVLIKHTDADIKTVANGGKSEDGNDIRFELGDGTQLKHEVESYTATTGEIIAWVKIPTLSYTADTEIYIYYGKTGVTSEQDVTNVWSSFTAVYHLNEASGASSGVKDRTSNANHMTEVGSQLTYQQSGPINKSVSRTNSSAEVGRLLSDGNLNMPSGALVVMLWAKLASTTQASNGQIFWQDTAGRVRLFTTGGATFQWRVYETSSILNGLSVGTLSANTWYHLAVRISNTTSDWAESYRDGSQITDGTTVDSYIGTNTPIALFSSGTATQWFYGNIAHVKVSSVDLTAGWITTEYNNQSNPSTFYTLGTEEASSTVVFIPRTVFFV